MLSLRLTGMTRKCSGLFALFSCTFSTSQLINIFYRYELDVFYWLFVNILIESKLNVLHTISFLFHLCIGLAEWIILYRIVLRFDVKLIEWQFEFRVCFHCGHDSRWFVLYLDQHQEQATIFYCFSPCLSFFI